MPRESNIIEYLLIFIAHTTNLGYEKVIRVYLSPLFFSLPFDISHFAKSYFTY